MNVLLVQAWLVEYQLIWAPLVGFALGSFANVVIARLPQMITHADTTEYNLCWPNSQCPQCQQALRWWHNIPLVSYLLLRGRCAFCQLKISLVYPLIELSMAALTLLMVLHDGLSGLALAKLVFCGCLLSMTVIDWRTHLLPDSLTYSFLWLGLLLSLGGQFATPANAILGVVFGYSSFWLIGWTFYLLRGKWGMGYGDYKLLAGLGAWLGWQWLPFVVVIAASLASLYGLLALGLRRIGWDSPLAFGPFLAVGGVVCLFCGPQLLYYWPVLY